MKKRTILDFLFEILLIAVSAFLYALSFPSLWSDAGWPIFALFSLVPLLYVIDRSPWSLVWLYGLLFGSGFFSLFNYWLSTFHQLAIYLCGIAKGLELAIVFPFLKAAFKSHKRYGFVIQALAYAAYTFVFQHGFFGYAYGQLGSALYLWPAAIQIADITGIWGVSFLAILPQCFIDYMLLERRETRFIVRCASLIVMAWILNLAYGMATISFYKDAQPEKTVRIAAIQHDSDTWKGGYTQYLHNFELLKSLTLQAMNENPDLVIWSETAFVPSVSWHTKYPSHQATAKMVDDFVQFGLELDVPLVTGNPEGTIKDPAQPAFLEDGSWNRIDYNSVILFADGQILGTYRKQHLVPFTEYFPYQDLFPDFTQFLLSHDYNWWLEGTQSKVFEYDGYRFSTSICFEDTFGNISQAFVKQGSDLLLNLSNDSWSKAIPAETQHMALGVFRSVENKRSTVRSTNSGITTQISPWGQIIDPIEPFTASYHVYDVPIYSQEEFGHTIYTMLGDWFAIFALALSASFILLSIVRRRAEAKAFPASKSELEEAIR